MKQAPPTSLKIVGRDINVELLDVMDDRVGEMDHLTNTIRITKGQQQLTEADTLLHECLHSTTSVLSSSGCFSFAER